jgi:hypothetical protein
MSSSSYLTTGEVFEYFGGAVLIWRIRRVVDALATDMLRAGQYRLVPRTMLGRLEDELRKCGYLREVAKA